MFQTEFCKVYKKGKSDSIMKQKKLIAFKPYIAMLLIFRDKIIS